MNNIGDILNKKGIKISDFKDTGDTISERSPIDDEIEFYEEYLKLMERNASEKEICRFANEHGFISEKHLRVYVAAKADYEDKCSILEDQIDYLDKTAIDKLKKEKQHAFTTYHLSRTPSGYRFMLRSTGIKDINAYGVNVLKTRDLRRRREDVSVGIF